MSKMAYKDQLQILRQKRGINKELTESLKITNQLHKQILEALGAEPKTVPELVEMLKLDAQTIFWHINALRKYGKVIDGEKKGDYWRYARVQK